ncbi:MAG: FkbM family methyltransferase [Rhodospirillaceae bacterium]
MSRDAANDFRHLGRTRLVNNMHGQPSDIDFINLSFSISGEDLVLKSIFKEMLKAGQPGFYVDVGCFDARNASNTYLFYCYGWRGLCIDANPYFAADYANFRSRDVFMHAAVGTRSGLLQFAKHKTNQGMSRIAAAGEDIGSDFEPPVPVPSLPLGELLRRHVPPATPIDFMSVDLEGGEMDAFTSNDWSQFRPRVIVLETLDIDEDRPLEFPTVAFLAGHGYKFRALVGANVVMAL